MTTTLRRLSIHVLVFSLGASLGAGVYAASLDQFPGRFNRPFLAQRGGPGGAGPGGPGAPMGLLGLPPMIADRLGLSETQREQIRSVVESRRDEVRTLVERSTTARQTLETAVMSRTFDESTIRARSAELAVIEADMAVTRARIFGEVVQLLTPEQQKELDTLRSQMEQRRQTQIERRANRPR